MCFQKTYKYLQICFIVTSQKQTFKADGNALMMENIKISAVKVSAKIPETNLKSVELFCKQNGIRYKWFNRGQHIIVFDRSYTFTIFKNCSSSLADQHVNITKLKNLNISSAIEDLAWILDVEPKKIFAVVDNITAVGREVVSFI